LKNRKTEVIINAKRTATPNKMILIYMIIINDIAHFSDNKIKTY